MAIDPAPRANHARYLVVLAVGAFALPLAARILEAFGAPKAPAGVTTLLLGVLLVAAILIDPPRAPSEAEAAAADAGTTLVVRPDVRREARSPGRLEAMREAEEPHARL